MFAVAQTTRVAAALAIALANAVSAQEETAIAPEDSFSLESAILDTSIPFALGAHEARQELRGAFGWPTFQEGLVGGVYFRFDPDGYARFSPNARLDTDVFEVICRPRTHVCLGRKGAMSLTLSTSGQIQLKLENIAQGDSFFIAEGVTELQLPVGILQPLDQRLELLLSTGGDLVVRRGHNEVDRISLRGFGPVSAYLRWVSARQDYSVLPRDWPTPNDSTALRPSLLTHSETWPNSAQNAAAAERLKAVVNADVAEVRGELRALRDILLQRDLAASEQPMAPTPVAPVDTEVEELQRSLNMLSERLAELQGTHISATNTAPENTVTGASQSEQALPHSQSAVPDEMAPMRQPEDKTQDARRMVAQLEYLMTEIGLDPEVAMMLVQQQHTTPSPPRDLESPVQMAQSDLIEDIISELRTSPPVEVPVEAEPVNAPSISDQEFRLLSDYFKSVFKR